MIEYKAFVSVTTYANNENDATAPVGELSKISRSFSQDNKVYPNAESPEILLNMFSGYDVAAPEVYLPPSEDDLAEMQMVAEWVINRGDLKLAPSDLPSYIDSITGHFIGMTGEFSIGNLVEYRGGYFASSVRYATAGRVWRLWFSDAEFRVQYDEYQIKTVFPIDNIDDLHRNYSDVSELLRGSTSTKMLSKIMQIERDAPATINKGQDYTWHDQSDTTITLPISFAIVIYGRAGDNIDVIREAIVKDILAVSNYDRSAWAKVLPELFSPNEMVFIPYWNSPLESYDPLEDDIYQSSVRPNAIVQMALDYTPNFSPGHIQDKVVLVPTLWRGIVMSAVPHEPANDDPSPTFTEMYPDYILAKTTDTDFHRMNVSTRDVVSIIFNLLKHAETYNDYTVLPEDYSRTERAGKEFITVSYDGYLYHALTKRSCEALSQPAQ
tara:strand:+ start:195745 stop:197061 length:1317 start_codon:yes stop_codon:yes gene_type:complete